MNSVCATAGGSLFCPKVPGEVVEACFGASSGDSCEALGIPRTCDPSWEGILICDITSWETVIWEACDGLEDGDECIIVDYEGYAEGTCHLGGIGGQLKCETSGGGWGGYYGLLDGLNVDTCGNV